MDIPQQTHYLMLLAILASIAIAVIGAFINRLYRELDKKVPAGEYEEYRTNMALTVNKLQNELARGHDTFKVIHGQLASMNTILAAIAVKMEVTDVEQIIKKHIEKGNV